MSISIKLKHSSTPAKVPGAGDLATGELALNVADVKAYIKNSSGDVVQIAGNDMPANDTRYVLKAGSDMTGDLTFNGNKIELDASAGNATFAGNINADKPRSSTAGNNTGGLTINPSDTTNYYNFRVDDVDNDLRIDTNDGADKIKFSSLGDAAFAGNVTTGKLDVEGNGRQPDESPLIINNTNTDGYNINSQDNGVGTFSVSAQGSVFIGDSAAPSIALLNNGSMIAAGDVKIGGTSADPNIELDAAGNATFAGRTNVGSSAITSDVALKVESDNSNATTGSIYVQQNNSAGNVFVGRDASEPTSFIGANGAATFVGSVTAGNGAGVDGLVAVTSSQLSSQSCVQVKNTGATASDALLFLGRGVSNTNQVEIRADGSATFVGDVTANNVTFNLEPDNEDNYEVSTETYTETEYIEVPVVNKPGTGTADIQDGVSTADLVNERETKTVAREVEKTREVKTYVGPTMEVKDTLLKITAALTGLKAAAESASTCDELKAAINTALADI